MKILLAALIFLLVLSLTFFIRINQGISDDALLTEKVNTTTVTVTSNSSLTTTTGGTSRGSTDSSLISITALAQHNSASDCWIAYKGKVYDMTSYLGRHPGGTNAIARYCGSASEFEQAFTRQHGTSKAGLLVKVATFIGDFDVKGSLGN